MSAGLIFVAGGSGKRFQNADSSTETNKKKQYTLLDDKPIFVHTLQKFVDIDEIDEIVVVCPADDIEFVKNETSKYFSVQKSMKFVSGGSERVYSVINGFNSISDKVDLVLIHDAVRPFIEKTIVVDVLREAEMHGGAIVAVPVKDTLKFVNTEDNIVETVDRQHLFSAQTPQAFKRELYARAVENWRSKGEPIVTDDAMLLEFIDEKVKIVVGSYQNIKITKPEDLLIAKGILSSQQKQV